MGAHAKHSNVLALRRYGFGYPFLIPSCTIRHFCDSGLAWALLSTSRRSAPLIRERGFEAGLMPSPVGALYSPASPVKGGAANSWPSKVGLRIEFDIMDRRACLGRSIRSALKASPD